MFNFGGVGAGESAPHRLFLADMTTINFYSYNGHPNTVNKQLGEFTAIEGNLRQTFDVLRPTVTLRKQPRPTFNYCYIPDLGRYYFVDRVSFEGNNAYELALRIDVLKTYESVILAATGRVSERDNPSPYISNRETDNLDMDGVIKCAVECVSENTTDWVCAPILWILVFGGAGGIFCRCVNILDNAVGYKTDKYKNFGYFAAKLDDIVNFIPSRICAYLMLLDVKFLKLDKRNARRIFYRDRKKTPSPNSAQTQSVCAGALGITIGSDEYYDGQLVRKPEIGSEAKPVEPNDIYWANQLLNGTAAICILLCIIIRAGIALLIKFL